MGDIYEKIAPKDEPVPDAPPDPDYPPLPELPAGASEMEITPREPSDKQPEGTPRAPSPKQPSGQGLAVSKPTETGSKMSSLATATPPTAAEEPKKKTTKRTKKKNKKKKKKKREIEEKDKPRTNLWLSLLMVSSMLTATGFALLTLCVCEMFQLGIIPELQPG